MDLEDDVFPPPMEKHPRHEDLHPIDIRRIRRSQQGGNNGLDDSKNGPSQNPHVVRVPVVMEKSLDATRSQQGSCQGCSGREQKIHRENRTMVA